MLAFSLALLALASSAVTPPAEGKVAQAKRGMIEDADAVFIEAWTEPSSPGDLTMTQSRGLSRWVTVGTYLGACKEFVTPTMKADWLAKLDNLNTTLDAGGEAGLRAGYREGGLRTFARGDEGALDRLTVAQRKSLCSVNLEAARQVLAEIQF